MPRGSTYADNSYNRSLGRVGAAMGSMPVSASSRSSGGGGCSGGYSSFGSHSSSSYVDNSFNRSVGRVGMPKGSMPVSASSRPSSGIGNSSSSGSHSTYVDNSFNRSVGRVGMPKGSMPVSASSRSSSDAGNSSYGSHSTYVDNSLNRSLGRVGAPKGSMPVSASSKSSVLHSQGATEKVYVDNPLNRRLGRVGEPLGSMPHSSSSKASGSTKVYVDNSMNRKLGRVGLKLGSMPVSSKGNINSRKQTQPTHFMREMYDHLQMPEPAHDFDAFPANVPENELENMCDVVFDLIRHMNHALKWSKANQGKQPHTALKTFKYDGPVVKFEEIEFQEKIGHGGFGDVYFAKYKGTVVAVKKLRVQRVSQRRLRQFQDEVGILCRLDHPHIVKFLGACVTPPRLAILMEYMQKSLYDALHIVEQDFTPEEQYQILLHIADGLAYLHGVSIAHCDMKSTNILLDYPDDRIVAKISDFGLSMMKSEAETSQSSAKVQGVGTPKYSAPEVLAGKELDQPAMCKTDVYSMSVVAWEVVSQEVPFSGLNIHQLMRRVCSGDVDLKFPDDVDVADGLKDLLRRCWSSDARRRPSAQAFKERLEELESIHPVDRIRRSGICRRSPAASSDFGENVPSSFEELIMSMIQHPGYSYSTQHSGVRPQSPADSDDSWENVLSFDY